MQGGEIETEGTGRFEEDFKTIFGDEINQPVIKVPADLMEAEKKSAARTRLWEKRVDMTTKHEIVRLCLFF